MPQRRMGPVMPDEFSRRLAYRKAMDLARRESMYLRRKRSEEALAAADYLRRYP